MFDAAIPGFSRWCRAARALCFRGFSPLILLPIDGVIQPGFFIG
ncbi:hypothetical protein C4K26_0306 [Pseudomonas chlororaphis]|nr:hypothetical protein C4K26_0306 [Pseudomonas chlororaphis]